MKFPRALVLSLPLLVSACATSSAGVQREEPLPGSAPRAGRVTGMIGVTDITALDIELDSSLGEADSEDLTLPLIGAAYQFPSVSRTALEWGFEAGFGIGWDSEHEAVVVDTGTVLVVADNDLRLIDLYGGLYAATKLGRKWRAYGGAGPVLQFGRADLDFDQPIDGSSSASESGVGYGYYTRAGLEYEFARDTWIGLVARWADTKLDLGGEIDELELEAVQLAFAVTTTL